MKNYITRCLAIVITSAALLCSCGNKKGMSNSTQKNKEESYYNTIHQGSQSNHVVREVKVITSMQDLQDVYHEINQTRKPGIPVPDINFKKESVIVAYAGQKNTGGFSLKVASIEDNEKHRNIKITVIEPQKGDVVTMALTTSFLIISTTHEEKEITASF